jgi:hypothetical protein
LSHPDIAKAVGKGLLKYYDFVKDEATMGDLDGHGTHCASILLKYAVNAEIHVGKVFETSHASSSSLNILTRVRYIQILVADL